MSEIPMEDEFDKIKEITIKFVDENRTEVLINNGDLKIEFVEQLYQNAHISSFLLLRIKSLENTLKCLQNGYYEEALGFFENVEQTILPEEYKIPLIDNIVSERLIKVRDIAQDEIDFLKTITH